MNKVIVLLSALALSGCASQPIKLLAPEYKVVKLPESLYDCPVNTKFPDTEKLTNQQVGSLLIRTHQNNLICKNSLDGIKKWLDDAEATINASKK